MGDNDQTAPNAEELLRWVRMRMAELQPLVAEYTRLEDANKRLTEALK